jgi:hypothetical protein
MYMRVLGLVCHHPTVEHIFRSFGVNSLSQLCSSWRPFLFYPEHGLDTQFDQKVTHNSRDASDGPAIALAIPLTYYGFDDINLVIT